MTAVSLLMDQFEANRSHRLESLRSAVTGLSEEEALWQADCYQTEKGEADLPAPGTILWHLVHLAYCNRYYVEMLRGRTDREIRPRVKPFPSKSAHAAIREFEESNASLRAETAHLNDEDRAEIPHIGDFISACLRHEIWHGGQIALIRRLYRSRHQAARA